jgi:GntR family transcriptional regulator
MLKTTPKYMRIKDDLIKGVEMRRFNDRLPSENELARCHRVSRMTARKALDELVQDGIACRVPGKGTFLKKRNLAQAYFHIHPFSENGRRFNVSTRSRLLRSGLVNLPRHLDTQLAGKKTVCIRRVHYFNEQPACYEVRYLRADLCASILGENLDGASIHDLLVRRLGISISRVWQRLEATRLAADIAGELDTPPGVPVLCMHQRLYSLSRPVSYVIYHMRSDLYAFEDTFLPSSEWSQHRQDEPASVTAI